MDIRTHIERGFDLFNEHDLDIASDYAADAVEVTPLGTFTGRGAIAERYRELWTTFTDARMEPTSWTVAGDTLVVEYTVTGTHSGPMTAPDGSQIPATGRRAEIRACSVVEARDGQTVSHRMYFDMLQMMTQLGLVPAPA